MNNMLYIVTGPAGVGKSTISKKLASIKDKSALIEGDDIYNQVIGGYVYPWLEGNHLEIFWEVCYKTITTYLNNGYDVVFNYIIEPEDYYINTFFNSDQEFTNFLNTIKGRTNYDYKVNVSSSDKVLTLSTCTDNGKRRVVIHSRKVIKEDAE